MSRRSWRSMSPSTRRVVAARFAADALATVAGVMAGLIIGAALLALALNLAARVLLGW